MLPVFEELNGLLFYPLEYEGEEASYNVFYGGSVPSNKAVPTVEYLMSPEGGSVKRWVLEGTDYVYPRTSNKIIRAVLHAKGFTDADIRENYTPFGFSDWQTEVAAIKAFGSAGKKTAVISTINGDANVPFYKELANQGVKATDIPVIGFSMGEEELVGIDTKNLVGHLAGWAYFKSVKTPANKAFISAWHAYIKNPKAVTNDPMEAEYILFHMWAHAVEQAGTTDVDAVRQAMIGQKIKAPSGFVEVMQPNHHLTKPVMIGEIQANGQFNVVYKSWAGGAVDVTTRANLQMRQVMPNGIVELLEGIQELGLTTRGAGADNIRNLTGSPIAGVDPQELIDTRPLVRELHHYILNHRELYGLPRKFNIAFDGGGQVTALEDTNDIGFAAVRMAPGAAVPEGVHFRMLLGGVTGHGDFARDCGMILKPEECLTAAIAVVRVFIAYGDRTDRKRARLKYLLQDWGIEKFLAAVEKERGAPFVRMPRDACLPRGPIARQGHIGAHPQRQDGLCYLGVAVPVGRLTAAQLRGLGDIAAQFGGGALRLTVWQNVILTDISAARVAAAEAALEVLGLAAKTSAIRGALVACTGNTGCKFSATDTKGQALLLADELERRLTLDQPVSITLTGCPNSCAQHLVADIGLLGTKVGDDMIEGYSISVGGGAGGEQRLAREIFPTVPMAEVPARVESLLRVYLAERHGVETFHSFAARYSVDELKALAAA